MKFPSVAIVALGLAMTTVLTAGATEKGDLKLTHPVLVNGTELQAGEYRVKWEGSGSNVQVKITQGWRVVASFRAETVDLPFAYDSDADIVGRVAEGATPLHGLRFQGKSTGLQLLDENAGMPAASGAGK